MTNVNYQTAGKEQKVSRHFSSQLYFNSKRLETREQRYDGAGFIDTNEHIDYFKDRYGIYRQTAI